MSTSGEKESESSDGNGEDDKIKGDDGKRCTGAKQNTNRKTKILPAEVNTYKTG